MRTVYLYALIDDRAGYMLNSSVCADGNFCRQVCRERGIDDRGTTVCRIKVTESPEIKPKRKGRK